MDWTRRREERGRKHGGACALGLETEETTVPLRERETGRGGVGGELGSRLLLQAP